MDTNDIRLRPKYSKDKDAIWAERFEGIADEAPVKAPAFRPWWTRIAAAVAVLVLCAAGFCYMRTVEVLAPNGSHQIVMLPDGSQVTLNAGTRLSYKPYWWPISRRVSLEGEAFFDVEHGRRFTVVCGNVAEVRVLGTEFNVFVRDETLRVACLEGRVQVKANGSSAVLNPGMNAELVSGSMRIETCANVDEAVGWMANRFYFYKVPLGQVIAEMERQYDISIRGVGAAAGSAYTGKFVKPDNPAEMLEIIGRPFGLNLEFAERQ